MADGDTVAVFRPRYDPDLFHRRRYSAAGTAPPPVAPPPFERAPRLKIDEPLHTAFTQRQRRRFAPPAPARSFSRQARQATAVADHVGLIHFIRANRGTFPILPYDGPHDRARRVPLPTFDLHHAFLARHYRRIASFGNGPAGTTQVVRLAVGIIDPDAQSTQVVRLLVGTRQPPLGTVQLCRMVIGRGTPCVTKWQQLWRIKRRDGVFFRYTSLDVNYTWGDEVFKTCGGMMPSASEDGATVGAVSNQELRGIFKDDGITEAELYAGLFNDAFVEVWIKSWDAESVEVPHRIAAGWTGNLQHEEGTFNMELIGPGARLDQQAIVQPFGPGCRWVFGSDECGVDREALKLSGVITAAFTRGTFIGDVGGGSSGASSGASSGGLQWENGLVRWLDGRNAGLECEVKTADFNFDQVDVELWELAGFPPEVGDTFELLPGCDLSFPTCKNVYNNGVNFGGFKDVPGEDSVSETPDAKIS